MENKYKNKVLAIIGSDLIAQNLSDLCNELGIETHAFSFDPNPIVEGHCTKHHLINIFDYDKIIEVCKEVGVNGIIPTTELTIDVAANLSKMLGLNGMPTDVSKFVTNKGFVRSKLVGFEGIKQPDFQLLTSREFKRELEFPIIVKPTNLGGKRGISVAKNDEELKTAVDEAFNISRKNQQTVILEEFIAGGREFSVESLSYHGMHTVIQVTEKITSGPPHCVELGHMQPANISKELREKVERNIPLMLAKVGVDNTVTHTEIKIVDDEIYLIELNSRFGGDFISHPLTTLSTGYNFLQGAIDIALNVFEVPEKPFKDTSYVGILFYTKQSEGLKELFDTCEKYSWLYEKHEYVKDIQEIIYNDCNHTNHFIYKTKDGVPQEIKDYLNQR